MLMRRPRRFSPTRRRGGPPRGGGAGAGRTGGGGSGGVDDSTGPLSPEPEHLFVQAVLAIAMVMGAFALLAVVIFAVQVLFAVTGVLPDR